MQKQLLLFLSPVEMLIFNTLFENVLAPKGPAPKGERLISLTLSEFETLRQGIIEAKITRSAEEFIDNFIESMIDCGLLVRVNDKSEKPPIGELRPTVAKDEIAGPNYSVERGVFSIATPLKVKAMPASPRRQEEDRPAAAVQISESQPSNARIVALEIQVAEQRKEIEEISRLSRQCGEAIGLTKKTAINGGLPNTVQHLIDSPALMSFSRIDKFIMFLLLSPFGRKWFLRQECNDFMENHNAHKVFGQHYQQIISYAINDYPALFERKEISNAEKATRRLPWQTRYSYRLSEAGIARAQQCLKELSSAAGQEPNMTMPTGQKTEPSAAEVPAPEIQDITRRLEELEQKVSGQGQLLAKCAELINIDFSEQSTEPKVETVKYEMDIMVKSPEFMSFPIIDQFILLLLLSPFVKNWATTPEFNDYIEKHGSKDFMTPKFKRLSTCYILNQQNLFERKRISDIERQERGLLAPTRWLFRLTPEGESRARRVLKHWQEITGTKDKAPIGSDAADARAPGSENDVYLKKTAQVLHCPRFRELSYIDMMLIAIGVSPFAEKWFTRSELGEFIEQCGKNHPLKRARLDAYLDGYGRKAGGVFEQKKITRAEKLKKWYSAQVRVQYRLTALGRLRTKKLLEKFE